MLMPVLMLRSRALTLTLAVLLHLSLSRVHPRTTSISSTALGMGGTHDSSGKRRGENQCRYFHDVFLSEVDWIYRPRPRLMPPPSGDSARLPY